MAFRIRQRRGLVYTTGRLSLQGYQRIGYFDAFLGILRGHWQDVLDGAWFIPGLIASLGFLLGFVLVTIDHALGPDTFSFGFHGSADTARSLLSTIASALLTVTALVISVTLVMLQLVSAQFTSRALRGLLSDRIIQTVIGSLVGIFAYCIVVLIAVRDAEDKVTLPFVPELSITVAIIQVFVCLVLLLIFISRVVYSMQVSHITGRIARQTLRVLHHPYPGWGYEEVEEDRTALMRAWSEEEAPTGIYAATAGYIQTISLSHIEKIAQGSRLRISLLVCPGDFVTPETVVAEVWSASSVDAAVVEALQYCISIARERDIDQDALFGVRQLADIALRALSPAVNDPTTAVLCIGYLGTIFEYISVRNPPLDVKYLGGKQCALLAYYRTFQEYIEVFVEISRYAADNARVVIALLEALAHVAEAADSHNHRERLLYLATVTVSVATPAIKAARTTLDCTMLTDCLHRVQRITGTQTLLDKVSSEE
jgi:uncharacterized membrane protein